MTGLEKILKHIREEAESAANEMQANAENEAKAILAAAKKEGEGKRTEILQQSQQEIKAYENRTESAIKLNKKRAILNAKQSIILNVIQEAKTGLINLPDKEYFDVIVKMIGKFAHANKGVILFSKADMERLPQQFSDRIKEALSAVEGASLEISRDTRDIDGGFILVYGDIEENCSFEALFEEKMGVLTDKVNDFLLE